MEVIEQHGLSARTAPHSRITAVIGSLGGGGAERNILRLASAMADRGHDVTLLTVDPDTGDFFGVPDSVLRVRADPASSVSCRWYDTRCLRKRNAALRNSILGTRPELVLTFIDTINISVLLALRPDHIPVIVSERIHPAHHRISPRWRFLRWLTYPRAARVVLLAEESRQWAERFWPRWRIECIANPVFPPTRTSVSGAPVVRNAILGVGRLQHQKGFDLLIDAFARVADLHPDWDLVIFGEGPDRTALTDRVNRLGLSARVRLPGAKLDPLSDVSKDNIFVFSSRYEGFGMALAEAMAAGLPVISFDCPSGPGRIVRNGVDGLLVPPEDVDGLSHAMERLIGDGSERARLAARAPEVMARFSAVRIFDQWDALIRDVLQEGA